MTLQGRCHRHNIITVYSEHGIVAALCKLSQLQISTCIKCLQCWRQPRLLRV